MNYIYFHIWDGHFKMWGYQAYKDTGTGHYRLTTYHGKITDNLDKLRQIDKDFDGSKDDQASPFWECYDYVKTKIQGKLCKGYVPVPSRTYSVFASGEMTLSEFIAEIEGIKTKQEPIEANAICEVA